MKEDPLITGDFVPDAVPQLKDSGERMTFDSGMLREPDDEKPMFGLIVPKGVPYEQQMLTRFAVQMTKGAKKYNPRNWEKANSEAEVERMKEAAFRHFMQWYCGETDEDHAAALMFNVMAAETTASKL